jgi:hypothetical protein
MPAAGVTVVLTLPLLKAGLEVIDQPAHKASLVCDCAGLQDIVLVSEVSLVTIARSAFHSQGSRAG